MKFDTHLVEKIHRAADIWSFRFKKPAGYDYTAGQWGAIDMQRDETLLSHHFTHSSSPTESFLELTTRIRDSDFKRALVQLEPGDQVQMEGPFGSFVLRQDRRPAVFLTGGIGITPVRSIMRFLADGGADPDLTILFANRDEDNIAFREELTSLERAMTRARLVHVLSEPSQSWSGERGHLGGELLKANLPSLTGNTYYVSGPPGLVQAMLDLLDGLGVTPQDVVSEKFDGYE
jgi:ferredoxin-NADP reductase